MGLESELEDEPNEVHTPPPPRHSRHTLGLSDSDSEVIIISPQTSGACRSPSASTSGVQVQQQNEIKKNVYSIFQTAFHSRHSSQKEKRTAGTKTATAEVANANGKRTTNILPEDGISAKKVKLNPKRVDKLKRSSIWDYFHKTDERSVNVCKTCGVNIVGCNTSNCWSHMRKHHPDKLHNETESTASDTDAGSKESEVQIEPPDASEHETEQSDRIRRKRTANTEEQTDKLSKKLKPTNVIL